MSERKRLLNDLRVVDLRAELEKRNLDKSGVRGVLITRLSKHLEEEGHDPATYEFELGGETKTPVKRVRRSESAVEAESEETPAMEDMIVQDDAGEDDDVDQNDEKESQVEEKMENETQKANRKRELTEDNDSPSPKKACIEKNEKEDDLKAENNTDAEDSINLELGEDELLNEETDHTAKSNKKDEAEAAAGDEQQGEDQGEDTGDQQVTDEVPPSSETGDGTDNDKKDEKERDDDKKDRKDDGKEGGARNLWVSGLSGDTRAKDLKQLCSKHGKVIGAKVVTNARTPGSRCYGYVTMASAQDAESCIKNLHRTELHGRIISVEKAKSESESASRRQTTRDRRSSGDKKDDKKEEGKEGGDEVKKEDDAEGRASSRTREKSHRSEKERGRRGTRSKERRRSPREVLSFSKIWKERDMARARERSRLAREEERRRRAAEDALRERERRQRQEKHRLVLEREKLRQEREKIEREKNELLRLERERHRLEREKLELERLELKRAQLRLEDERRKRGFDPPAYRKSPVSASHVPYDPRHKRPPPPPSGRQFEAPPPPRFDAAPAYDRDKRERDRDYKRDYRVSASVVKYPANGTNNEEPRQPPPPGARPKEPSRGTYEARSGYRSPPKDVRSWAATRPNYQDPAKRGGGTGATNEQWSERGAGGGYRETGTYFQPLPPGAYPDRTDRTQPHYPPQGRDYRKY